MADRVHVYVLNDGTRYDTQSEEELTNGDIRVELTNGNVVEFSPHEVDEAFFVGNDGEDGRATQ